MGTTLSNGTFSISSVPAFSNIVATATATVGGVFLTGTSVPVAPVIGGVTNVGTILVTGCNGIIYDNGPVNGFVNAYTISNGFAVTNSFVPEATTVTNFDFYVWEYPGDQMLAVQWYITGSPFGGTIYGSGTVTSPNLTDTFLFSNGSFNIDKISASGLNVGLISGGTYYLELYGTTLLGNPVLWDQNSGVGCQSAGCPSQAFVIPQSSIPSEAFDVACQQQ